MFEKLEGIIIRTQDYGETHKIVTLFSKRLGKLAVIARGAKKPKSRMAAVSQAFIHGEYLIQLGRGMGVMQQGEVIMSHRKIREDIVKTAYVSYLAELTDKLIDEKKPNAFIFEQLEASIAGIEEDKDPDVILMMYEMKLYALQGFQPILDHCIHCGRTEDLVCFSIHQGGTLCNRCVSQDQYAVKLSPQQLKLLRMFSTVGLERVQNISVKLENKVVLKQLLADYLDQHGGIFLKSRKFLAQLNQLN